jgi:exopolysaccharide biosynthesis protein
VTVSTVTYGSGDDTVTYYVADVTLTDATALQSAFANNEFGTNITETTSGIAQDNGAVFAINGDYYGFRDTGIEIRNGVIYRDDGAREGLAFYRDGTVEVYDETTTTAQELLDAGVWNTLSFGPAIVEDGQVVDGIEDVEVDTNVGNHSIQGDQPRTAVGVIDDNHLVFVVVDGRQSGYSEGVTMTELAAIMQDLGATTAYNIDGGGSSTMYFDGAVVNSPSQGEERGTSDILYIAG